MSGLFCVIDAWPMGPEKIFDSFQFIEFTLKIYVVQSFE